jgi:ubiquinone/menaquinone biosynthesis C-methylase UbiE
MIEMPRRRDVMHMSAVEKLFVNHEAKGRRNFKMVGQIMAALPTGTIHRVLELGCGIGTVSALLAARYPVDVIGTDSDPAQIEIARVRHPETDRLHYRVEDASKLSCTDFFFDLVIAQNTLHHVRPWEKAVAEVGRVLRPGGYFIWDDVVLPRFFTGVACRLWKNRREYTLDRIAVAFAENGFRDWQHKRSLHGIFSRHTVALLKA